jgi:aldose 1-epimerase
VQSPSRETFGVLPGAGPVDRWTLADDTGASASILTYGAILQELRVPGPDGAAPNVVLGFDNLSDYLERSPYFGCVVGRYANRIAGSRFELDGKTHLLPLNDGVRPNTLHGGAPGFGARLWQARAHRVPGGWALTLSRTSPDGEEGFPGTLEATVRYTLADSRLALDYAATTSAPTVVGLTSHAYFNLSGEGCGDILDHELTLAASAYLPVDWALIPTGAPEPVAGTPFDFRSPHRIGDGIGTAHPQLQLAGGYDHCFVLDGGCTAGPRHVATLREPRVGRQLRLSTTEPGLQMFTSDTFDGRLTGPSGRTYGKNAGVALETQHFPDSPNRPDYPSTVLRPGTRYRSTTVLDFAAGASVGGEPAAKLVV